MGYTHYWRQRADIAPDRWRLICEDARKLIAAAPCSLLHEYNEPGTAPDVGDECIFFNGDGDEGHETFFVQRSVGGPGAGESFSFCKTARKPYDSVVCAILACVREHAGDAVKVSSDGDNKTPDEWPAALTWGSKVLGRKLRYPVCDKYRAAAKGARP